MLERGWAGCRGKGLFCHALRDSNRRYLAFQRADPFVPLSMGTSPRESGSPSALGCLDLAARPEKFKNR